MYVLKIKDENGNWIIIPNIEQTSDLIVDQTYNAESENAQSGKAMREAFENVPYPSADNEAANKIYVDNEIFYVKQGIGNINEALEAVLNGGG